MFEDWSRKAYTKIIRNPCNLCLVKVTCVDKYGSVSKPCEKYIMYTIWKNKVICFWQWIDTRIFLLIALGGILFIFTTFIFGVWKWVEIFAKFFFN